MSLTCVSTTQTRVRAVSLRRTITSPTCKKNSAMALTRTRNLSTEKPAAPPKPLVGTTLAFTLSWETKNLLIQELPQSSKDSQKHDPDWLISSLPLLSQDAALDVCVASSNAAAAGGDAAQVAFVRKISHYRHEIPDLRAQGIVYRPLVWTADVRPHPAVTRTLQYAADSKDLTRQNDLVFQDMDFLGRSCCSETAADVQPTGESLNLNGPPLAVPNFISPTPKH